MLFRIFKLLGAIACFVSYTAAIGQQEIESALGVKWQDSFVTDSSDTLEQTAKYLSAPYDLVFDTMPTVSIRVTPESKHPYWVGTEKSYTTDSINTCEEDRAILLDGFKTKYPTAIISHPDDNSVLVSKSAVYILFGCEYASLGNTKRLRIYAENQGLTSKLLLETAKSQHVQARHEDGLPNDKRKPIDGAFGFEWGQTLENTQTGESDKITVRPPINNGKFDRYFVNLSPQSREIVSVEAQKYFAPLAQYDCTKTSQSYLDELRAEYPNAQINFERLHINGSFILRAANANVIAECLSDSLALGTTFRILYSNNELFDQAELEAQASRTFDYSALTPHTENLDTAFGSFTTLLGNNNREEPIKVGEKILGVRWGQAYRHKGRTLTTTFRFNSDGTYPLLQTFEAEVTPITYRIHRINGSSYYDLDQQKQCQTDLSTLYKQIKSRQKDIYFSDMLNKNSFYIRARGIDINGQCEQKQQGVGYHLSVNMIHEECALMNITEIRAQGKF